MIDAFALLLPHVLLALAGWRLLLRDDLDIDPADKPIQPPADKSMKKQHRNG